MAATEGGMTPAEAEEGFDAAQQAHDDGGEGGGLKVAAIPRVGAA